MLTSLPATSLMLLSSSECTQPVMFTACCVTSVYLLSISCTTNLSAFMRCCSAMAALHDRQTPDCQHTYSRVETCFCLTYPSTLPQAPTLQIPASLHQAVCVFTMLQTPASVNMPFFYLLNIASNLVTLSVILLLLLTCPGADIMHDVQDSRQNFPCGSAVC